MNYIEQLNYFYDLLQGNRLSNNAQLLYHTLLMINNKCSWIEWFQRTNISLCSLTGMGEKALINARNELKQINLIDFITSKKRGECTKYKICTVQKQVQNTVQRKYKGSTNAVQPPDINKLNINKTNTPKSPIEVEENLGEVKLYSNWKENLQCDCISKSTNTRCLRKSTYNINGKNYCRCKPKRRSRQNHVRS